MNYEKIYNELIEYRRHNSFEGYGENHHIIPESLGGSDDDWNMVRLTAREHFIAHLLLAKFDRCPENVYAVLMMCVSSKFHQRHEVRRTSRTYDFIRRAYSEERTGWKHSEESKKKMSNSQKNREPSSEETRKKISDSHKGKPKSEAHKANMRKPKSEKGKANMRGIPKSEEHKQKLSKAQTGKKASAETKEKLSNAAVGSNNPMYGKKGKDHPAYGRVVSEETKMKLRKPKTKKRPPVTDEARENMRQAQLKRAERERIAKGQRAKIDNL